MGMSDLCSIMARKSLSCCFCSLGDGQCGEIFDFGNIGFVRDVANSGSVVKNGFLSLNFECFLVLCVNLVLCCL